MRPERQEKVLEAVDYRGQGVLFFPCQLIEIKLVSGLFDSPYQIIVLDKEGHPGRLIDDISQEGDRIGRSYPKLRSQNRESFPVAY